MNRNKVGVGLLLVSTAIILNQLKFENDLVDFIISVFIGLGFVILLSGFVNLKSKQG